MKIINSPSLKKCTTLGIGGIAQKAYVLEHIEDIEKMARGLEQDKLPYILLGGGSNVLIEDGNLDIILIQDKINAKEEIQIIKEDKDFIWINVSSGKYLPLVVHFCVKHGFSGLEGLIGVPGRMGGALAMNAGAFNCQIVDVFESARIFSPNFGMKTYTKEELIFDYRFFSLKEKVDYAFHADMILKLKKSTPEKVKAQSQENFQKKKNSQPVKEKTAGSTFKNPSNIAAGKLLQDVQLKGYRINSVGFSDIHANFLVNYGNATYNDAMELINLAKERVLQNFNVELHTEVKIFRDTP